MSRGKRLWLRWSVAVGAVAAVLGVLTQVLDLTDRIRGDEGTPPPARDGAITGVRTDQVNASRHGYCREILEGVARADCLAGPDGIGTVFAVGIRLAGYEGRCCHLDWKLIDADSGTPPSPFFERRYVGVADITVRNEQGDIGTYYVFVPHPRSTGIYDVSFFLADTETDINTKSGAVIEIP